MSTGDDMQRVADKYAEELRRVAKEASKEFERAAAEVERIGVKMAADLRSGMKDGGVDLDKIKERTLDEVNRSLPAMAADLKDMQRRINERADHLQKEMKKIFK
jgi:gas vesicle protein